MKRYTVNFLFTPNHDRVWLIEKQKPDWQKGCLNGIGGEIEDDEEPVQCAVREIKEEAGIDIEILDLTRVGMMRGLNNDKSSFIVHIFTGVTNQILTTQEQEEIGLYDVDTIKSYPHIENVPMLIETCIYRLTGSSSFESVTMEYDK